jgi:hypothetical protein
MNTLRIVLGIVMVLLGAYLALHPLWSRGRPVTQSIWFDMAFAALFLLRGAMNLRGRRRRQGSS